MSNVEQSQTADDEIDLKELFLSLWAYKVLIAAVSALFLVAAGLYAVNADRLYTAQSTFTLSKEGGSSGFLGGLGGELGGFAALVGAPTGGGGTDAVIERVTSREFILEAAAELELQNDKLFNSYDPNYAEPVWKAVIKSLLGMQTTDLDAAKVQLWNVTKSYQDLVAVDATDTGAISISVQHKVPERAAEIANHLVSKIIAMTSQESVADVDEKLRYLSRTLADASQDLEDAQRALQEYSLENSTQAVESFAVGSVMLDDMRTQRQRSAEQLEATIALKVTLAEGQPSKQDYDRLAEAFPQLDQANFRRIMGLSEVTSAWSWPNPGVVAQVEESIRDRLAALDRDILKLEEDARRYAASAEELARFTRDFKVAEAAYTVLIEQVKSQSLVAGFKPDNSRILEIADVPITASEPKRNLILALGLVLGIFVGSALALVLSMRRGVYFSLSSLLEAVGTNYVHKVKGLRRFKGKDIAFVQEETAKGPLNWARQTVLELDALGGRGPVIICDVSSDNNADVLGRIIAATSGRLDRNTALIDLSRFSKTSDKDLTPVIANELVCVAAADGCSEYAYLVGNQNLDMMYSKSLKKITDELAEKHELVIFAANSSELDTVTSSSIGDRLVFVARVRPGRTPIAAIQNILKRGTVGVTLHA